MRSSGRQVLPLVPLLHAYAARGVPSIPELHRLPGLGPRFSAILAATARFLYPDFLDKATDEQHKDALVRFYESVVGHPLHADTLRRRSGFVRHGVAHLLLGRDGAARKIDACLSAAGPYRVPGLGPSFWSALLQGMSPARYPAFTARTRVGLERTGIVRLGAGAGPGSVFSGLLEGHAHIRTARGELTSLHIDYFLSLLSVMPGRDVHKGPSALAACPVTAAL